MRIFSALSKFIQVHTLGKPFHYAVFGRSVTYHGISTIVALSSEQEGVIIQTKGVFIMDMLTLFVIVMGGLLVGGLIVYKKFA